ncbi:hypothetical protein AVEN_215081-1 [Araneus ventricosus]|uniref:Tesmin/TSO1-like CXC domain-containing protein n=1 Tax=Araneus ventricosus TaxID=182803 RepID=A0A4Y2T5Y8_ARAVE|nr:hypothetical protein AVEN_215081-1 [Araneus ventricosus]
MSIFRGIDGWLEIRFSLDVSRLSCKKRRKNACGCRKAGLICSSLCTCSLGEACENVSDINLLEDSIEDEDDTP